MEKTEWKYQMPSNIEMADAERFKESWNPSPIREMIPTSEAGSVANIYAQAVAALRERLAYWQQRVYSGKLVETITVDVKGIPELQAELSRYRGLIDEAQIERDQLKVECGEMEVEIHQLKNDRDVARECNQSLRRTINDLKAKLCSEESEGAVDHEKVALSNNLAVWKKQAEILSFKLTNTLRTAANLQGLDERLTKELAESRDVNEILTRENRALDASLVAVVDQRDEASRGIVDLQAKLADCQRMAGIREKTIKDLRQERDEAIDKAKVLDDMNDNLMGFNEGLSKRVHELEARDGLIYVQNGAEMKDEIARLKEWI